MILAHAPLADEARALIAAGVKEIEFPHANEAMVARYAASLQTARDMLMDAGIVFGVSGLVGEF
jgi:2-keto-3-deoxy-6-phosphogluconate aldolase